MRCLFWVALLVAAPGFAESFSYDEAGRLSKVTYDDGTSISYRYDAAGNLLAQTAEGTPQPAPTPQPGPCGCTTAPLGSAAFLAVLGLALRAVPLRRARRRAVLERGELERAHGSGPSSGPGPIVDR